MLRGILFDMGGTLDGDGHHWLDRFVAAYAQAGFDFPREIIRKGFDDAERRASCDEAIVNAGFEQLVRAHLGWQFDVHGISDAARLEAMVGDFVAPIYAVARRNRTILADLHGRGLALGVVSNACGNVRALCDDVGYTPYLRAIVDSRVVGVAKPDPRIYTIALESLALEPSSVLMVGDNYERDIVPAHGLGMQTAWLVSDDTARHHGVADVTIAQIPDLMSLIGSMERTPA